MNYDVLIVHWRNNTVTAGAFSHKAKRFFDSEGWKHLHEITDIYPDEFIPELMNADLIVALKSEGSEQMSFLEPVPDRTN